MKKLFFREDDTLRSGWKIFAFIISFLGIFILINILLPELHGSSKEESLSLIWRNLFFSFLSLLFPLYLLTYLFEIYWNKEEWEKFQLSFAHGWLSDFAKGLLFGITPVTLIFLIYAILGYSHISLNFLSAKEFWQIIWHPIIIFLALMSLAEELLFRGYILRELSVGTNKLISSIILSFGFALVHINNEGATILSTFNIFLIGMLFSLSVFATNRLWFAWGMHFGWNYFMGPIFSFNVSGHRIKSLFYNEVSGPNILIGGDFGPEGGLICTFVSIVLGFILWRFLHNKLELYNRNQSID